MFDSVVIDVVIALAVIFLVFSLVTAGIREFIARIMETRAKELWRTLRRLVDDPILSDLREVRTAATALDEERSVDVLERADAAEDLLRRHLASGVDGAQWRETVERALTPISDAAPENAALASAVDTARTRLIREHATGRRGANGARRAAQRGGERPVAPPLPQTPTVPDLAVGILNRARTLTDAIHDHPLVRQLDRTWPGFASRMSTLRKEDFSAAVTDLLRAVGIEDSLRRAFAPLAAAIERYDLTDEQKAELWQPIQSALDDVRTALHGAGSEPARLAAVLTSVPDAIASAVDGVREQLPDPSRTFSELTDLISETRHSLSLEEREPLDYVRLGAGALAGFAPVGDIVDRIGERVEHTVAGAFTRMEALRDEVGTWYDSRMTNLSEWYRRRSRIVAFGIGLLVVLAFNVDAVGLSLDLWRNESVRDVVVAVADQSTIGLAECVDDPAARNCVNDEVDRILAVGLPIGWDIGTDCDGDCTSFGAKLAHASGIAGRGLGGALVKLLGWVLAAAALAMGASFWFDVLAKATGVRKKREA